MPRTTSDGRWAELHLRWCTIGSPAYYNCSGVAEQIRQPTEIRSRAGVPSSSSRDYGTDSVIGATLVSDQGFAHLIDECVQPVGAMQANHGAAIAIAKDRSLECSRSSLTTPPPSLSSRLCESLCDVMLLVEGGHSGAFAVRRSGRWSAHRDSPEHLRLATNSGTPSSRRLTAPALPPRTRRRRTTRRVRVVRTGRPLSSLGRSAAPPRDSRRCAANPHGGPIEASCPGRPGFRNGER